MMQIKRKFLNSELQATKIQGIKNSDHKQFFFLILFCAWNVSLQTLMECENIIERNWISDHRTSELKNDEVLFWKENIQTYIPSRFLLFIQYFKEKCLFFIK